VAFIFLGEDIVYIVRVGGNLAKQKKGKNKERSWGHDKDSLNRVADEAEIGSERRNQNPSTADLRG
jgi:hypothetical protein